MPRLTLCRLFRLYFDSVPLGGLEQSSIDGMKIHWIESKASFGDDIELRKNVRRQLKPYTDLFGTGAVVYWFGFVEGIEPPEGVMLLPGTFFDDCRRDHVPGKHY